MNKELPLIFLRWVSIPRPRPSAKELAAAQEVVEQFIILLNEFNVTFPGNKVCGKWQAYYLQRNFAMSVLPHNRISVAIILSDGMYLPIGLQSSHAVKLARIFHKHIIFIFFIIVLVYITFAFAQDFIL